MKDIEIFEKVKTHLLTQMEKSVNAEGACMYRGDNGKACAAGCLIKDDFYKPEFENVSSSSSIVHFAISQSIGDFSDEADTMISCLQYMHDNQYPNAWEQCLNTFKFTPEGEYIVESGRH